MPVRQTTTALHYLGYDDDRGGIVSVVRALASTGRFVCVLGVNPGFGQARTPALATFELPAIAGETISISTLMRARAVARAVRAWLAEDPARVFHGHSRAGMLVALWLARWGERRVVASVHCYGRQRWFYRWAAGQLGTRLFWLSPAMKRFYGIDAGDSWQQCVPPCIPAARLTGAASSRRERPGSVMRFCGAGSLVPWKSWHLMLDALAALPPSVRSRVHFSHIGGVEDSSASHQYAAGLRARTTALGLGGQVEWRGEQPASAALLAESDCAVVLSQREPFSMVMLEALASGIPVLASAAGGPTDVIQSGGNGWFFEPGNARSLAQQLAALVETDVGQMIRIDRGALGRFAAPAVAEEWAQVYQRLRSTETERSA